VQQPNLENREPFVVGDNSDYVELDEMGNPVLRRPTHYEPRPDPDGPLNSVNAPLIII